MLKIFIHTVRYLLVLLLLIFLMTHIWFFFLGEGSKYTGYIIDNPILVCMYNDKNTVQKNR